MSQTCRRCFNIVPRACQSQAESADCPHLRRQPITKSQSRPHNPNCDGDRCRSETGTVKLYPLGGGANLILCLACWAHENEHRRQRGRETGAPENWPVLDWSTAETYGGAP